MKKTEAEVRKEVQAEATANITTQPEVKNQLKEVENQPNPGRLMDSLRYVGYSNYTAIEDIIDNSIDAKATKISLITKIHPKPQDWCKDEIMIIDNGYGMGEYVLGEALRLGSEYESEKASTDLGRFGMGLSTASLSICRKTSVLTREDGSDQILKSVFDLDKVEETNRFIKDQGPADEDDVLLFNRYVSDSGTIIILSKIDFLQNHNSTGFNSKLIKDVGRIFRVFINQGLVITVNDKKVEAGDPLFINHPDTKEYESADLPTEFEVPGGSVSVKMVMLPDIKGDFSQTTQGFYIMRNYRELFPSSTLNGVFKKHNHLNRFRAELKFDSQLDNKFGINFKKDAKLTISQDLLDSLINILRPHVMVIQNLLRAKQVTPNDDSTDDDLVDLISNHRSLLKLPKPDKLKKPRTGTRTTRRPSTPRSNSPAKLCGFKYVTGERNHSLFESEMEGIKTIITININHPFYKKYILNCHKNTKDIFLLMLWSFGNAEQCEIDENNSSLFNDIRKNLSSNLSGITE